ncbi:MAG TPA: LuxR C-terminal-related transcriptional regulator, partial [Clostridia bacterium]|nr:LuxR C-terminal-related transcriptional regulator [Clostridia bacterium]
YLKASRWYEKSNMMQEAMDYSIRSNNHQNTARLIEKYGEIMIINRDLVRIANIIEALPDSLIIGNSKICALYTMAVSGRNSSGNNAIFIGDIRVSFESKTFIEAEEDLLLIRLMICYANEDFKPALEYGNRIHGLLSDKSSFQCLLYKVFMQICCVTGNTEKAKACLDKYISAIKKKNYYDELFVDIIYTHALVQILCGAGEYKQALNITSKLEKKLSIHYLPLPAAASSIYMDLGYLYYEYDELELSYDNIKKCIEISSIKMDFCRLISGYILVARINQNIGDCADMLKYIKKAEDLCSKHNARLMSNRSIAYIVRMLLSTGETEYAEYFIRKYKIDVQNGYDVLHEEAYLVMADFYIAKGELDKAGDILDRQYKEVMGTGRDLSYIRIMILKALLSKLMGNEAEAVKYIKDTLEKASGQGYISTFKDYGAPVAEIICKALNHKEESGLVNEKDINYALKILAHIKESKNQIFNVDMESMKCLSKRESEVLEHIFYGLTNKEIASKLYVAECTVKKHINNIYTKIGAVNREKAIKLRSINTVKKELQL